MDDLDAMMLFANGLVEKQRMNPTFGTLIDGPVAREEEARWLVDKLAAMDSGKEVSVVAEVDRRLAANSEVVRGRLASTSRHGVLAISFSRGYRQMDIGRQMLRCLIDLSREARMKPLELHVRSTNPKAFALCKRLEFDRAGLIENKARRGGESIDVIIMTRKPDNRPGAPSERGKTIAGRFGYSCQICRCRVLRETLRRFEEVLLAY